MSKLFEVVPPSAPGRRVFRLVVVAVVLILLLAGNPIKVIPAGHVGVKDFFGSVSPNVLPPGVRFVFPFTRVVKMSIQTQEVKETAEVPSKEGLTMELEGSLLFRLDPEKAANIYKTVGQDYQEIAVHPQIRSAIREITASYEAKVLYSAERERISKETLELFRKLAGDRGIIAEAVLLRKIGLPAIVANAIQEKLRREQEAEQMKFVLQKEQQEAERKRIEAQGIADFQRIVAAGISPALLEWKGIEATEKLAMSQNSKVVVIGSGKNGLPLILGGEGK
ncbi:MAG: membrane protease subunit, stomatin/prohibitin [Acidobacteria bacterium]|nr:MAG: membrane protease subunit, stomatin/prohibitin [Acidobacteriota bacterium]PYQ66276.1 MAG: membrane protease subunit, stomatin/prohibitin [Acidobacteriota bacterium]